MTDNARAALLICALFALILCGMEAGLVRLYGPEPGFSPPPSPTAANWQR
jgi:hypothetical protein